MEEKSVIVDLCEEEGVATSRHGATKFGDGMFAVEGKAEVAIVGDVCDVRMGFFERAQGGEPFLIYFDEGDDVCIG